MHDELQYHSLEALEGLSLAELQSLWELVPTERQRGYRAAYEREVRTAGAGGSDVLELQLAKQLLERYQQTALVPVGSRWVKVPTRVQEAASQNMDLLPVDNPIQPDRKGTNPKVMIGFVLGAVLMVFMLSRVLGGGGEPEVVAEVVETPTPTPEMSPTPTPLALEAQDDVIGGSDSKQRVVAYPVNLQVSLPDDRPPRVWVVQRRTVAAAQWNYDENPDIASFVSGMSVRPVIGIPFSEENDALFNELGEGAVFTVTMNTGAILRYEFAAKSHVLRSDTAIFRQVSPGLVLLLIGGMDDEGQPSATRTLITATYPPEQELARGGVVPGFESRVIEGVTGDLLTLGDVQLRLNAVHEGDNAPDLPAVQQRLRFDFDVLTGELPAETTFWQMTLVDAGGQTHAPETALSESIPLRLGEYGALSAQVSFVVPADFPAGTLLIRDGQGGAVTYRFSFTPEEQIAPLVQTGFEDVSVQMVSVTYLEDRVMTQLRIYNGRTEPLHFSPDDIWLSLGYIPDPPGPRNPALALEPFLLLPEQAVNLSLIWNWSGEPFAALQVGGWRYAIQLTPASPKNT